MTRDLLKATIVSVVALCGCAANDPATKTEQPASPVIPLVAAPSAPPLVIGFGYVAPVGDAGWIYAHDQGRKAVEAQFGSRVKTLYVTGLPEGPKAEVAFRQMADHGAKLVFGTSLGYMDSMLSTASEYKHVKFEHAEGHKRADNLRTYNSRLYEGAYLAGVVAASKSKRGTLGVVASVPVPEVLLNINSFTLGAQSVNPKARTRVAWTGRWFDPAKERAAAQGLINGGADVLFQNTDSSAVQETAKKNKKFAVGWLSDQSAYGGDAHLASAVINWGPYYVKTVNEVLDGTWRSGHTWWGVKEGAIDLVGLSAQISPEGRAAVEKAKAGLKDGSLHPFQGPVVSQAGKILVAKGATPDDAFMLGTNFYVRGVEGKVPTPAPAATLAKQ
jgi:basic membrane protein A